MTNVLLITTHDINPHLGTYAGVWPGAEAAITPNLDQLAADGIRYDAAFAAAPVCAPSRSAMMTGCYPSAIGTMHMRTRAVPPPDVRLLPQMFREAGYYTLNNCFTDYQMDVAPTVFDDISASAHWRNAPPGTPFFAQFHGSITHESQIYLDDEAFAAATSNVREADRHDPDVMVLPPYYPDTPVFRRSWARYLDLITEMDHEVGRLLAELDDDGLRESTLVVFVSDHGLGMPRAKRWANEAGLREPLIARWPGVIPAGTVDEEVAGLIDLAPTLLASCGLAVPAHMHGEALFDMTGVSGNRARYTFAGRDRMDEQEDMSRSVRDKRFRYTRNYHPDRSAMQHHTYADTFSTWREFRSLLFQESQQLAAGIPRSRLTELQRRVIAASKPEHELYDIAADPHEQHNLAQHEEYGADLERLAAALEDWQRTVGDLGLVPEEDLIESWRPNGVRRSVQPVSAHVEGSILTLTCPTPGATIGWTTVADAVRAETDSPPRMTPKMLAFLGIEDDQRSWKIHTEPLRLEEPIIVKAWRIGYAPTEEVVIAP